MINQLQGNAAERFVPRALAVGQDTPPTTDGFGCISDAWVPSGDHRAHIDTSYGSDNATIHRGPNVASIVCDSTLSPGVEIRAVDSQRVAIELKMPFPFPNIKARGPIHLEDGVAHMRDELTDRTADLWLLADGTLQMAVHQPGSKDIDLHLRYLTAATS